MTTPEALKTLYAALGGEQAVASMKTVDVLAAIAELYGGEGGRTIPEAISGIAANAGGLVKPTGTKSITTNGNDIDVAAYAKANVAVPSAGLIGVTFTNNSAETVQVTYPILGTNAVYMKAENVAAGASKSIYAVLGGDSDPTLATARAGYVIIVKSTNTHTFEGAGGSVTYNAHYVDASTSKNVYFLKLVASAKDMTITVAS